MKRIGILLLTLAMLLSLAACGAKDTQTIKAEEKQGTEQTASGTAAVNGAYMLSLNTAFAIPTPLLSAARAASTAAPV